MPATERRSFGMHANLLYDVITRQAGTLQKAILEGVMNAIDAGASACHVTLSSHAFTIEDDGHGFQSREEIEDFFETFGTPHAEGDAVYGRYRMGRGQIMAFGVSTWRSRWYEMHVDIKTRGLDYDLVVHEEDHPGTRIAVDLYDPVMPSDLERIRAELRKFVMYAQIPVFLDGTQISGRPEDARWDHEDSDAWYRLSESRSQLAVYNLGVLVGEFWSGRFGIGGTIVSKRQLDVNFARNDIQSGCPVFKRIQAELRKRTGQATKKKTKLTPAEREMLVRGFLAGEAEIEQAMKMRVLTDVTGRAWELSKLARLSRDFANQLVVGTQGDQLLETAQRRKIAFSLDESTLERFGATDGRDLLDKIAHACRHMEAASDAWHYGSAYWQFQQILRGGLSDVAVLDRNALTAQIGEGHIALTDKDLTPEQKILLDAMSRGYGALLEAMNTALCDDRSYAARTLMLGRSDTALAWTDGTRRIWVEAGHARLLRKGLPGAYQIAGTLLHEMLHEGPDTGTHQHDIEFYMRFHDFQGDPADPLGAAARAMTRSFISLLRGKGKKVAKTLLLEEDTNVALDALRGEIAARAR